MAGKKSPKIPRCVLTLKLLPEPWQADILEKRFYLMELLRSELIHEMNARYDALIETPEFQDNKEQIRVVSANLYGKIEGDAPRLQVPKSSLDARLRQLYNQRNQLLKNAGFTKYGFDSTMMLLQKKYKDHIATQVASSAAADVWRSFYGFFYKGNPRVQEKPHGTLKSVANKSSTTSMRYEDGTFFWNGGKSPNAKSLAIRVKPPTTEYEKAMLEKRICLYRIVRNRSKNGISYSLQITLEGVPALKKTHFIGTGAVGIYIDQDTATVCTGTHIYSISIPPYMQDDIWEKIVKTQDKMRASRRATNPDNYNRDGTIKSTPGLKWVNSQNYMNLYNRQKHLGRKARERNRHENKKIANFLLTLGDEFYVNVKDPVITKKNPAFFLTYLNTKLLSAGKPGIQQIPKTSLDYGAMPNEDITPASYKAFLLMTSRDAVYGPERGFLREGYVEYLANAKYAQGVDI